LHLVGAVVEIWYFFAQGFLSKIFEEASHNLYIAVVSFSQNNGKKQIIRKTH